MKNKGFAMRTGDLKQCAKGALEYGIANIIKQYELKFNVKVTSITLGENGVMVDWVVTARGIRTDAQVQQLLSEQCRKQMLSITEKLANNEQ